MCSHEVQFTGDKGYHSACEHIAIMSSVALMMSCLEMCHRLEEWGLKERGSVSNETCFSGAA